MRRSDGEYPIVRFSRRFLGVLRHNRGSARIHTDDLTSMAGNVHQQDGYKEILRGLGLVRDWTGTYRRGSASSLYRLTDEANQAYEVDSVYVARRLGCTTTWIADQARNGDIPRWCIVAGTGRGKPWKFHREWIDEWIESR